MKSTGLGDIITHCLNVKNKNTIKFIANLIELILRNESIKPYRLAKAINGFRSNKLEAKAKRIRELLSSGKLEDYVTYARYVIQLFGITDKIRLAMDRTNWEVGTKSINYLILSIIWHDVSLPIYWIALDNKGGNSDSETRIELIKWFVDNIGSGLIKHVLADREFPSGEFYDWLKANKITGLFRSRENVKATDGDKKKLLSELYKDLPLGKSKVEKSVRRVYNTRLYVAVKRIKNTDKTKKDKKTELLIVISTEEFNFDPFVEYKNRWKIEVMFNKFKTYGFNLESTSVTNMKRLNGILMLLNLAYCFSCYIGTIRRKIIAIKNKGKSHLNEFSLFRYGLDLIKHILFVQTDNSLCYKLWSLLNGGRFRRNSEFGLLVKSL